MSYSWYVNDSSDRNMYSMIIIAVLTLNIFHPGQYLIRRKGKTRSLETSDDGKGEA